MEAHDCNPCTQEVWKGRHEFKDSWTMWKVPDLTGYIAKMNKIKYDK